MTTRRAYALALIMLALGGVLDLVAFTQTWAAVQVPLLAGAADGSSRAVDIPGRELLPGAAAAGWVALAAVAGVVATRSWGRVVVGVVGLLSGVLIVVATVGYLMASGDARMAEASAVLSAQVLSISMPLIGPMTAGVAGVLIVIACGATVLLGRRWPAMGRRYERPGVTVGKVSAWDALDQGQDPTDDLVE